MSQNNPEASIIMLIGFGVILLILCGIMAWIMRLSHRLGKLDAPQAWLRFLVAFLQILLGIGVILVLREFKITPTISIVSGAGLAFASGLLFIKHLFKYEWKPALRIWLIATALNLLIVPVCTWALLIGWIMVSFMLFPPQF